MSGTYREQLDPSRPRRPGFKRWIKNGFNRLLRRAAKRDPQEAPTKFGYKGYDS